MAALILPQSHSLLSPHLNAFIFSISFVPKAKLFVIFFYQSLIPLHVLKVMVMGSVHMPLL